MVVEGGGDGVEGSAKGTQKNPQQRVAMILNFRKYDGQPITIDWSPEHSSSTGLVYKSNPRLFQSRHVGPHGRQAPAGDGGGGGEEHPGLAPRPGQAGHW